MTKKLNYTFNTFFLVVSLLLTSCVGTVEEGKPDQTQFYEKDAFLFNYVGIMEARGISHTKIEIYFKKLSGENFSYFLHVNGATPIKLNLEDLGEVIDGKLRYVIEDLDIDKSYLLKVSAENEVTNEQSQNEIEYNVKTYKDFVPDFKGVQNVELVPGSGDRRVMITWFNPGFQGGVVSHPNDPAYYEVAILKEEDGIENLKTYNTNSKVIYRRIPKVDGGNFTFLSASSSPTYDFIDGLDPDTSYLIRMRVIHQNWRTIYDDRDGSPYLPLQNEIMVDRLRDGNTKLVKIRTLSSLESTNLDLNSVTLRNVDGKDAYTKISVNWPSATGSFLKYRVFYKLHNYDGNPADSYEMKENHADLNDQIFLDKLEEIFFPDGLPPLACNDTYEILGETYGCLEVEPTANSTVIEDLVARSFYQVKIAVCRDEVCTLDPNNPLAAILTNHKVINTTAILAPFTGVTAIDHPNDSSAIQRVTLNFDSPSLTKGHATHLKLYCIDPVKVAAGNFTLADTVEVGSATATSATGISQCDGLIRDSSLSTTVSKTIVDGLRDVSHGVVQSRYCFSVVPEIQPHPDNGNHSLGLPIEEWVVRCVNPEIARPTLNEFPGFNGNCNISDNSIELNWSAPQGGLYDSYQIFFQKITGGEKLDFQDSLDNAVQVIENCSADECNYNLNLSDITMRKTRVFNSNNNKFTLVNPMPGTRYAFGILATLKNGGNTLFSEFNTGIKYCNALLPKAKFTEWTRIFAIGPKIDGRINKDNDTSFSFSAHLNEAINADGIPYELDDSNIKMVPPGNYPKVFGTDGPAVPATFTQVIDGRPNANGNFYSNQGIVSLAFKSVDVLNASAKALFESSQSVNGNREDRKYGYRIYRSHDNRQSWTDVTDISSLLVEGDYNWFKKNSNVQKITEKMVFFTDYSVRYQESLDNISYARVYWYKVVPVFKGLELDYNDSDSLNPHNEIKVTLPPANMALVHRLMANRQACISIGKSFFNGDGEPNPHYACQYNGVGSRPAKGKTWNVWDENNPNLFFDQSGDLLVDRYQLSCNFSRGDYQTAGDPTAGSSYFNATAISTWDFETKLFTASDASSFKGCTHSAGLLTTPYSLLGGGSPPTNSGFFDSLAWGDCFTNGIGSYAVATASCGDPTNISSYAYTYPMSASHAIAGLNCSSTSQGVSDPATFLFDATYPNASLRTPSRMRKMAIQGAHLTTLYTKSMTSSSSYYLSPFGPNDSEVLDAGGSGSIALGSKTTTNCYINLASIGNDAGDTDISVDSSIAGSDMWRSRWIPLGLAGDVKTTGKNLLEMSLTEVHGDPNLYNNSEYRAPDISSDSRFLGTETIGKVMTSNSAFLPPLGGIDVTTGSKLCEQYKVQVGYADDNGDFFSSSTPKAKRIPRRIENISMSEWPDDFLDNMDNDPFDYKYTERAINNVESGQNWTSNSEDFNNSRGGSCNRSRTNPSTPTVGDKLDSNYASGGSMEAIIGGSSIAQNPNLNTERCMSKYGIQDLIGNVMSSPVEELHCDFSDRTITLTKGAFTYDYVNTSTPNTWTGATAVEVDSDGNEIAILASGIDPIVLTNTIDDDDGYCSISKNDRNFLDNRAPSSTKFMSLFKPDGTVFSPLVSSAGTRNLYDFLSLDYLRNGDGHYLNFGSRHISPSLSSSGSLSIALTAGSFGGRFIASNTHRFNPIIGLPVNQSTHDYYDADYLPTSFTFDNEHSGHFIGSSASFSNSGMSEWCAQSYHGACIEQSSSSSQAYPVGIDPNVGMQATSLVYTQDIIDNINPAIGNQEVYVTKFIKHPNGSVTYETKTALELLDTDPSPGVQNPVPGTIDKMKAGFELGSTATFNINSMGSFSQSGGRYSGHITTKSPNRVDYGARCVVLVNEE